MARTAEYILDEANPNKLPSGAQVVRLGKALRSITRFYRGTVSSNKLTLPEDAKAIQVDMAYARTGTSKGWKVPVGPAATLAAGQMKVSPTGDVLFFGTDAVTEAEVWYAPVEGELVEETIQVAANGAGTLLADRQAIHLLEAEVLTGAVLGAKTVVRRGATVATTEAAVTDVGQVAFFADDIGAGGGTARVLYVAQPNIGATLPSLGERLSLPTAM